jgi:hypothetical protein
LAKTLLEVVLKSCKLVYIVLDGLDEYSREDRKELASWFQKLIVGVPKQDYGAVRCLFISQEDGYARKDLSMLSTIKITHADNYADIKSFCEYWHQQIEVKFGLLEKREHHVTNIVSARAQGIVPRVCKDTFSNKRDRDVFICKIGHLESPRADFSSRL